MGKHSRKYENFVCLALTFILCWQFGCSLRDRTATQLAGPYVVGGVQNDNSLDVSKPCELIQGLPCHEVDALRTVLKSLGDVTSDVITRLSCSEDLKSITTTITCSTIANEPDHITSINVQKINSSGYLHKDVSKLEHLEFLFIISSQLTGSIPDLMALSNLKYLSLQDNQLTGSIPPTLGYLTNLTAIDLSKNQLQDSIPPSLGNLSKLTYLSLQFNQLTGGIPETFNKLHDLNQLSLRNNFLDGNITFLGELVSLEGIDLRYNKFEGQIPEKLKNNKNLTILRLDENLLDGKIPKELGDLKELTTLSMNSNNLSGGLPANFSSLTQLNKFEVGGNSLTGKIPGYIKDWGNLYHLNLLGNNFEGPFPPEILIRSYLTTLWVSDLKNTSFKLPDDMDLPFLSSLIMRNCLIEGKIPQSIGNSTFIDELDLSYNKLTGDIPESLNSTFISHLYLTGNDLTGPVPNWVKNIEKYDLSYNKFTDESNDKTGQSLSNYTENPIINDDTIKNNSIAFCPGHTRYTKLAINAGGEGLLYEGLNYEADESLLKSYVSKKKNWAYTCEGKFLEEADDSTFYLRNMSCGATNVTNEPLHRSSRICPVDLTYYMFCLTKGSYKVKLYFAETVYVDDSDYTSLGKRVFDVWVQDKKKKVDLNVKEMAKGSNKEYILHIKAGVSEDNLLKISLKWAGKGSMYLPVNGPILSAISVTPHFIDITYMQMATLVVVGVLLVVLLLVAMWRMELFGDRWLREKIVIHDKQYPLKEIIEATGNFSTENEISTGPLGIVYKAELHDSQIVAVRKLYTNDEVRWQLPIEESTKKFSLLMRLRGSNIVRCLQSYSKKNLNLLIYENMSNLSLEKALFGPFDKKRDVLNWDLRLKICKDIAQGLKYLYEDSTYQIIHGDLKATNVLLDQSDNTLTAKLFNYGMADFLEEDNQISASRGVDRDSIYLAPEYRLKLPLTNKVDVYSFGVLLLEIVSGKRGVEYNENETLTNEASRLYQDKNTKQLVDNSLPEEVKEQASSFVELAVKCTRPNPFFRPTMSEVLSVLEGTTKVNEISQSIRCPSE